jgi:hypothetical protein
MFLFLFLLFDEDHGEERFQFFLSTIRQRAQLSSGDDDDGVSSIAAVILNTVLSVQRSNNLISQIPFLHIFLERNSGIYRIY